MAVICKACVVHMHLWPLPSLKHAIPPHPHPHPAPSPQNNMLPHPHIKRDARPHMLAHVPNANAFAAGLVDPRVDTHTRLNSTTYTHTHTHTHTHRKRGSRDQPTYACTGSQRKCRCSRACWCQDRARKHCRRTSRTCCSPCLLCTRHLCVFGGARGGWGGVPKKLVRFPMWVCAC